MVEKLIGSLFPNYFSSVIHTSIKAWFRIRQRNTRLVALLPDEENQKERRMTQWVIAQFEDAEILLLAEVSKNPCDDSVVFLSRVYSLAYFSSHTSKWSESNQ